MRGPCIKTDTSSFKGHSIANTKESTKHMKPFIPPLTTNKAENKEELIKTSVISIFPIDIQNLAEYRQNEDKLAKTIGTAQLPYSFIDSNKIIHPPSQQEVIS